MEHTLRCQNLGVALPFGNNVYSVLCQNCDYKTFVNSANLDIYPHLNFSLINAFAFIGLSFTKS